jgi:integrase
VRREFGQVRQLRSGRWQARWKLRGVWYTARRESDGGPMTFTTARKAADHLAWVRREVEAGRWKPPTKATGTPQTLREYADGWLARRDLKPTTRDHYRRLLDRLILPTLGSYRLADIDQGTIEDWYDALDPAKKTLRAHAYALLRSILTTAQRRKLIAEVPVIPGAGTTKRERPIRPLSIAEVDALAAAMPERYRAMTLLAAWCGLRFGELTALRRRDIDLKAAVVHVDRGVTRTKGQWHESTPKAGEAADVAIPPHILPDVERHVRGLRRDDLLFPAASGGFLLAPTLHKPFRRARESIGRPDLRWHDLRHTGGVLAAAAGASPAELMQRLRHKTAAASQRYWHAAQERDRVLADLMSEMATGTVTPITTRKREEDTG